ncbi:MAG: hypothetical protein ACYC8V_08915, partial [Caulobacteraceae bacterium]
MKSFSAVGLAALVAASCGASALAQPQTAPDYNQNQTEQYQSQQNTYENQRNAYENQRHANESQ